MSAGEECLPAIVATSYSHPDGLHWPRDGMTAQHESQVPGAIVAACLTAFTPEDEAASSSLGPEYHASGRWAEAMVAKMDTEHLKPIIDKAAAEFRDKLWDDVRDWLLADTESNAAGAVREMVEQTIRALLTGREWAMKRYPFADYARGQEVREAVAKFGGDELLMRRIADLEEQIASKDDLIKFLSR
jgi:hypothetical protein